MADYSDEIATALELIEEFGQQCEWHKTETVPTDSNRPWLGGESLTTVHYPHIAFIPATDGASGFGISKFRQGEDVTAFSTFGLMGVHDFTPEVTDTVVRGTDELVIAKLDVLRPAEQPVLYILSIV